MPKKTTAKKATSSTKKATKSSKKGTMSKIKKPTKTANKVKTQKRSAPASSKKKTTKKISTPRRERTIQQIKQSLLSQREALLKEAEETLNSLPGEINFPDMGDQATAETDRNFMLRLRDRERMLLKKIEETIERIDNGGYGICDECGNEIGIKRLEARPVTTYCIDCKTRQEEEERIAEGG